MHSRDGSKEVIGPDSVELASPGQARDVIGGDVMAGRVDLKWWVDVEDGRGALVHSLVFRDAVTVG